MIDFSTINFTSEEAKEIAQLEATQPDHAYWLKTHIALERLGFIKEVKEQDGPDETPITQPVFLLTTKEGKRLQDLFADWIQSEFKDGVIGDPTTFVRLTCPEFTNVNITFRKQSEAATNSFSIHID